MYPRELTESEKGFLFYVLPEEKESYKVMRDRINMMKVIGEGRFGEGNYVLGFEGDAPDNSYSSLPIFATGQLIFEEAAIQIAIHDEYDNKIEYSISNINGDTIPEKLTPVKCWTYSNWNPGDPSPFDNDTLRQIKVGSVCIILISKANRSIWIHDLKTKFNHVIPVTNFLNELLRGNKVIDKSKGIQVDRVLENIDKFSDREIEDTLIQYNKQWRRLDLSEHERNLDP